MGKTDEPVKVKVKKRWMRIMLYVHVSVSVCPDELRGFGYKWSVPGPSAQCIWCVEEVHNLFTC